MTGLGGIIAGAVVNLPTASAQDPKPKAIAPVKLADEKGLTAVGGNVLVKDTPEGDILIVRSSDKGFSAMSNVCPHKECKVKVKSEDLIQCPCHKSAYKLDGTYIGGPSKKSLTPYKLVEKDGILTVYDN